MGSIATNRVNIVDIRPDESLSSLADNIRRSLNPPDGTAKSLSTLLLYDEKGLRIFEEITYLDEYYLTNAEIDTLRMHAGAIAAQLPAGSRLLELGSGNLRKVSILLDAFEAAQKEVDYYALDLSLPELERTFSMVDVAAYQYVTFNGLHGTYDDALSWLSTSQSRTTCVMTLGSSIGNFAPQDAAQFLSGFARIMGPADFILVGLDACLDPERVFRAYNDGLNVTERFYRNGLDNANLLLGYAAFDQKDWNIQTGFDDIHKKHHAEYIPAKDIKTKDFSVKAGEVVYLEESWKFSEERQQQLWQGAGLINQMTFPNSSDDYQINLLSPARFRFEERAEKYAPAPVPALSEWQQLWAAWDTVTKAMVPKNELLSKPIKLRNDLIFYLGHIPAFADIHHTRATSDGFVEPARFSQMFERGIDPDVDNPEKCHDHSEVPDTWPSLEELTVYQANVRSRFTESILSGRAYKDNRLARGYWLAYEHEAMHLETFLYMLIQSNKVLPPPGHAIPNFEQLAIDAAKKRTLNAWHQVPKTKLTIGLEDPENDQGPTRFFGWDIERPPRSVSVKAFEAQSRPISNGEYAHFLEVTHADVFPASWVAKRAASVDTTGVAVGKAVGGSTFASDAFVRGKSIRTVYGPVPLAYALDWPVMASYDELARYAKWANGRIPTLEETRSIYNFVESQKMAALETPDELISAVNGHLSNDGVEETPPSARTSHPANGSAPVPTDLFVDLTGCNVGFKHWVPVPVTDSGHRLRGQSDMGGLWEWTSTALAAFEGYKPMDLYPGYSADFFDDKHNICLGGSWATVPRIAGRRSFVNWYQHNYPYVWCTARLVRDIA